MDINFRYFNNGMYKGYTFTGSKDGKPFKTIIKSSILPKVILQEVALGLYTQHQIMVEK